jgi:3-hydroxy-9,10-secoandrosta-1,3,5(10)-triene-9,17-dione monooxygenase reductase component
MIDSMEFRRVLGHYPTGVCVVSAMDGGTPVGMVVGSFTSVSLDPPLVAFLPDRKSTSWPRIERAKRFSVNILSTHQQAVCQALSSKAGDKFGAIDYRLADCGLPVIEGIVAWIACDLEAVHDAGDHFIAIGRAQSLSVASEHMPLLFFQGRYGQFSPFVERLQRMDKEA